MITSIDQIKPDGYYSLNQCVDIALGDSKWQFKLRKAVKEGRIYRKRLPRNLSYYGFTDGLLGEDLIELHAEHTRDLSKPRQSRKRTSKFTAQEIDDLITENKKLKNEVGRLESELKIKTESAQLDMERLVRDVFRGAIPHHVSIEDLNLSGIYFLFDREELVYIGQSVSVIPRLRQHVADSEKQFTHINFLPCEIHELNSKESALISIFRPKYNKIGAGLSGAVAI